MLYFNIREEELKNKVAQDFFWQYDCSKIIGNVDFCVSVKQSGKGLFEQESLLWAEAKQGISDIYKSIVQLILTIGKARTFDKHLPPAMLGAFDAEKIAFIAYNDIHDIFYMNDFNWNVTPSNYETREFQLVYGQVKTILDEKSLLFDFEKDERDLIRFIRQNFVVGRFGVSKIRIDKNNFMVIYNKWLQSVKPSISVNWEIAKKTGIIDGDFYLADLLSEENFTLKDKLFVLLKKDHYELDRKISESGMFTSTSTAFKDAQVAHNQFWNKYERPPKEEYWDYIVERRDLLVPQDVRERKGSFFTPQIWVELSQKYLTDVLGEDWQDEYYVWDCAAGTGNLLNGLTNKYNIWASTLDTQDVEVMKDRIRNGANLLEDHVFQFDFLNDEFTKLPKPLQDIVNSEEKRKKLVIYINPPYAEHGNRTTISAHGEHKTSVANTNKIYKEFSSAVGTATRELFAQFFLRIYKELPDTILASFSTLKLVNSQNFLKFRQYFKAEYKKGFICNASTFDNVNGNFPIGFLIWDLKNKIEISKIETEIISYEDDFDYYTYSSKSFYSFGSQEFISNWLRKFYDKNGIKIGYIILPGVDMQQQNGNYFTIQPTESDIIQHKTASITFNNIIEFAIYLTVRQCIQPDWMNNRDQFLYPNDGWKEDKEFQNDCLTFSLFHGQNKITSKEGTNHWLPFTEQEVNAREKFESDFMTRFIQGKLKHEAGTELFGTAEVRTEPLVFSAEAKAVFDAGRELWRYYQAVAGKNPLTPFEKGGINSPLEGWQTKSDGVDAFEHTPVSPLNRGGKYMDSSLALRMTANNGYNVNASLYDIREYFQGRNDKGKMNNKSDDETYMALITALRDKLKLLARKIEPKVYEYGFLKE